MMKAKYIGDPRDGGKDLPDNFGAYGVDFERGKFVDVPDDKAAKIAGNNHFETQGEPPKVEPPAPTVAPLAVPIIPAK